MTRLTVHVDLSDALLRIIAKVHDLEKDSSGRATQDAVIDCLSAEMQEWLDHTIYEGRARRRKK